MSRLSQQSCIAASMSVRRKYCALILGCVMLIKLSVICATVANKHSVVEQVFALKM